MKGIFPSSFTRRPLRALTPPTDTHTPIALFLSILQRHRRPINIRARFSNRIGRKKWKVISLRTIDRRVSATARPLSRCHDSGSFQGMITLNSSDKSATFFKIYCSGFCAALSSSASACIARKKVLWRTCLYETVAVLINTLPKFAYGTYIMGYGRYSESYVAIGHVASLQEHIASLWRRSIVYRVR